MIMVEEYIKRHSGEVLSSTLKVPMISFAVFEALLLFMIMCGTGGKLHQALVEHGTFSSLVSVILTGVIGVTLGTFLSKRYRALCKYHVTSTSQFVNSMAWGVGGFVLLDTTEETALAVGVFCLSLINVFLAIVDEGWGSKRLGT